VAEWPYNTAAWKRLRLAKLAANPLCYACELRGRLVPAVAVDHVTAIAAGGDPFPPLDGLMSLCQRCHNEKTNAVDRPDRAASGRRFKGFDAAGNPIDPGDAWHGGGASDHDGSGAGDRCGSREDT
jgi:5-methylcytosine-specific restriction protein A